MLTDDLLRLVLLRLSPNTIYRLATHSKQLARLIKSGLFWRDKLFADRFILPKFPVDWREWYLRVNDYPISSVVYKKGFKIWARDVIQLSKNRYIDLHNRTVVASRGRWIEQHSIPRLRRIEKRHNDQSFIDIYGWLYYGSNGQFVKLSEERFSQLVEYVNRLP